MSTHRHYERLVDALLEGPLPPQRWEELRVHQLGCDRCRTRYDRAVFAERLLHGGPAAFGRPSATELERIGAAVLAGVGAGAPASSGWREWLRAPARWAPIAVGLAALAVAVPFLVRSPA